MGTDNEIIIKARGLKVGFRDGLILDGLDLDTERGEILGLVGASGTGKSVLLRSIVGLNRMQAGTVEVFGAPYSHASEKRQRETERRWGVLFQQGALFSALSVLQNIQLPMREHLKLSQSLMDELAMVKLAMVGLPADAADKFPSELSGGMIKRAALARALALDPDIVFLDEPTSGLDPIGAAAFDDLIVKLRDTLGLTVFMVTHDLDSLYRACDRIAVLGDQRVLCIGTYADMLTFDHPWVRRYFHGERARSITT